MENLSSLQSSNSSLHMMCEPFRPVPVDKKHWERAVKYVVDCSNRHGSQSEIIQTLRAEGIYLDPSTLCRKVGLAMQISWLLRLLLWRDSFLSRQLCNSWQLSQMFFPFFGHNFAEYYNLSMISASLGEDPLRTKGRPTRGSSVSTGSSSIISDAEWESFCDIYHPGGAPEGERQLYELHLSHHIKFCKELKKRNRGARRAAEELDSGTLLSGHGLHSHGLGLGDEPMNKRSLLHGQ